MSRTRRTAAEMVQDLEAKLQATKAKAGLETASQNPSLSPLAIQLETANKAVMEGTRDFASSNPNNFGIQVRKHELRIRAIQAEAETSKARLAYYTAAKPKIQAAMSAAASKVQGGASEEVVSEFVSDAIRHIQSENAELWYAYEEANAQFEQAYQEWKNFGAQVKVGNAETLRALMA